MASITSVISLLVLLLATYCYSKPIEESFSTPLPWNEFITGKVTAGQDEKVNMHLVLNPEESSVPTLRTRRSTEDHAGAEFTTLDSSEHEFGEGEEYTTSSLFVQGTRPPRSVENVEQGTRPPRPMENVELGTRPPRSIEDGELGTRPPHTSDESSSTPSNPEAYSWYPFEEKRTLNKESERDFNESKWGETASNESFLESTTTTHGEELKRSFDESTVFPSESTTQFSGSLVPIPDF
jgi:hypothetical protein